MSRDPDRETRAGPLAHAVSHELRGPLSTISYCCELIRGCDDDAEAAEYLGRIDRALAEARAILDGVVRYADGISERLEGESVDLDALTDDVVREMSGELAAAEASVEHDELPTVVGDAGLLRALLTQLLDNAVRHRRPGESVHVRVGARREEDRWHLVVDDDGPGIEKTDRERVFELFETGATEAPGAGVGLALCRVAARRHGGAIRAREAPGGGARLVIDLPADDR